MTSSEHISSFLGTFYSSHCGNSTTRMKLFSAVRKEMQMECVCLVVCALLPVSTVHNTTNFKNKIEINFPALNFNSSISMSSTCTISIEIEFFLFSFLTQMHNFVCFLIRNGNFPYTSLTPKKINLSIFNLSYKFF